MNSKGNIQNTDAYEQNRNKRADLRDAITNYINNISISDLDSVRTQASMLAAVTSQTDELTRKSGDTVMNQCIRLALSMDTFAEKSSYEELKQAAIGITSTIGNLRSGMSNYLNTREPNLNNDYVEAVSPPEYLDTDLENFWTKDSKFESS